MEKIKNAVAALRKKTSYIIRDDELRQELMFWCLNGMLSVISFGMTVVNVFTGEYILMTATLTYGLFCILNVVLARYFGVSRKFLFYLFATETIALLTFFVISGIPNGFSALWFCLIPYFALLIFGVRKGTIFSLAAFLVLIFLLWTPVGKSVLMYEYTSEFMLRFPFFYSAILLLEIFVETVRIETQKQLLSMEKKYFYLYRHDALTHLYNRYGFEETVKETSFEDCAQVSLLMMDIDDFKIINDVYSHIAGDIVLESLADVIKETLSKSDIYCRWGGEEFVALLKNGGDHIEIAQMLRENAAKRKIVFGKDVIHMTVSIGMCISDTADNLDEMLIVADKRLYEAKQTGKNRVCHEYIKTNVE